MHSHHSVVLNEPGALLYLHLVVQLPINDWWLPLEPHPKVPSLDVHHHILPLQPEVNMEGHCQLHRTQAVMRGQEVLLGSQGIPKPLPLAPALTSSSDKVWVQR